MLLILAVACQNAGAQRRRGPVRTDKSATNSSNTSSSTLQNRISDLSQQISSSLTENRKRTIAVVEFVDLKGQVTNFGRFLAEKLITQLYLTRKFKVIERQLLNKVITEQKLSLTGIIDQSSAQRLGRLLGVDAIASGTVTDLGSTLDVNARLIDTETAEVFAAASVSIVKDAAVSTLMNQDDSGRGDVDSSTKPQGVTGGSLKADSHFFSVELKQCRMSGSTVICDFVITNKEADRELGLSNGSRLFDDLGNQYGQSDPKYGNASYSIYGCYGTLISGVRTGGRITFDNVSPKATRIALLEILGWNPDFQVAFRFRNVPLVKQ